MSQVNAGLAQDISVLMGEAFADAIVVAFSACDDLNDPLSTLQKKQVISSCMSLIVHLRSQVECVLDLDDIARECVGDGDRLSSMFNDITIDLQIEENKMGFDD
jgi:hypothetical protein